MDCNGGMDYEMDYGVQQRHYFTLCSTFFVPFQLCQTSKESLLLRMQ